LKKNEEKDKWSLYFKGLFKKLYSKFAKEVPDKKGILNYVKLSLVSLMEIYYTNSSEKKLFNENLLDQLDGEKMYIYE
jgi:hypothetical protein